MAVTKVTYSSPRTTGIHRSKRRGMYSRVAAELTPDEPVAVVMTSTVDIGIPATATDEPSKVVMAGLFTAKCRYPAYERYPS